MYAFDVKECARRPVESYQITSKYSDRQARAKSADPDQTPYVRSYVLLQGPRLGEPRKYFSYRFPHPEVLQMPSNNICFRGETTKYQYIVLSLKNNKTIYLMALSTLF